MSVTATWVKSTVGSNATSKCCASAIGLWSCGASSWKSSAVLLAVVTIAFCVASPRPESRGAVTCTPQPAAGSPPTGTFVKL